MKDIPNTHPLKRSKEVTSFQDSLLDWYNEYQRDLPWRSDPSLYKTVISEFMLQQTRVSTVLPYFENWLKKFPDFNALANATEEEVLKSWEGLGYYSRARNLHKLAIIATTWKAPPETVKEWMTLPGVGPYIAAAVTSIALGKAEAVCDGNLVRVLSRIFAIDEEFKEGRYTPYSDEEMIKVLTEAKKNIPKWVRIMRVQREISPKEIIAGPKSGNLRQIVHQNLAKQGLSCKCIRCREAGLTDKKIGSEDIKLTRIDYDSSGGKEVFLSYEDKNESIYGFLRLRKPSSEAHRDEINEDTCIVREIHVYGKSLKLGEKETDEIQHSGLGKNLMKEAEKISKEEFDAKKILVISAVGTREYYQKIGYSLYGPYMSKILN